LAVDELSEHVFVPEKPIVSCQLIALPMLQLLLLLVAVVAPLYGARHVGVLAVIERV